MQEDGGERVWLLIAWRSLEGASDEHGSLLIRAHRLAISAEPPRRHTLYGPNG